MRGQWNITFAFSKNKKKKRIWRRLRCFVSIIYSLRFLLSRRAHFCRIADDDDDDVTDVCAVRIRFVKPDKLLNFASRNLFTLSSKKKKTTRIHVSVTIFFRERERERKNYPPTRFILSRPCCLYVFVGIYRGNFTLH